MKAIIITIIIFLLALLGFSLFNKKTTEAPTTLDIKLNATSTADNKLKIEKGNFVVDTEKSRINWRANKKVLTNWVDTGSIKIQKGTIEIENSAVKNSEIVFDMSTISASTTGGGGGQDKLTNHLKSADFFDIAKFPTSSLQIKSITATNIENQVKLVADLTMKDKTNEITFLANIKQESDIFNITGETKIDRTLWNVQFGSDKFFQNLGDKAISDEVNITFNIFTKIENETEK